jgi:type VI secretion system protein
MKYIKKLIVLGFSCLLAACGSTNGMFKGILPEGTHLSWSSVTLSAEEDVNLNSPVAVDVVMLHDEETLGLVQNLPASKWFATRDDLLKTFPKGFTFQSVEVVPGQTLQMKQDIFQQKRQTATIVFANYLTPGEHRVRVDQLKGQILIQLGAKTLTVVTVNPK